MIKVKVLATPLIRVTAMQPPMVQVKVGTPVVPVPQPRYNGPYTVTPTQETQVLATEGYKMTDNVTVNPIPSNYGLITWDGSKITVS